VTLTVIATFAKGQRAKRQGKRVGGRHKAMWQTAAGHQVLELRICPVL